MSRTTLHVREFATTRVIVIHTNRHGQTRIDNNLVENAIRPSAIGKKNWLLVGHPDAGQRSAIL